MDLPLTWYLQDYTDAQIEDAVKKLADRLDRNREEYLINQMAQAELVRILSNRKVQTVVKSVLSDDEENTE